MAFPSLFLRSVVLTLAAALSPAGQAAQDQDDNQTKSLSRSADTAGTQFPQLTNLPALATAALNGNANAIHSLRTAGPSGLKALLTTAGPQLDSLRTGRTRLEDPGSAALREATDAVARQRDAWASGLYWFTDLDAARAEARRAGRPILSLRLLGNLDEEYSCANSRFFRTVLYANAEVSKALREKFVLHWKSVRPAPLLTIDMGDGRRIKRTITGNSIHYLLDADGRVLDALPGLYSPQAFLNALDRATTATLPTAKIDPVIGAHIIDASGQVEEPPSSAAEIRAWHGREAHALCMEWLDAAVRAGAYHEDPRASRLQKDGQEPEPSLRHELAASAFPSMTDTPGDAVNYLINPPRPLNERQRMRFSLPEGPLPSGTITGSSNQPPNTSQPVRKVEAIQEFPFPTEFDPPKAMVERPVLQKTIPDGDALPAQDPASPDKSKAAAQPTEAIPLFPFSSGPTPAGSSSSASAPTATTAALAPSGKPSSPAPESGSSKPGQLIGKGEIIREFPYPTEFDPPQIPKAMVEHPILQKSIPGSNALPAQDPASSGHAEPDAIPKSETESESKSKPAPVPLADRMTPALWSRIAEPLSATVHLDEASRRLMVQKLPIEILTKSEAATGRPLSAHSPFGRQLARFEAAIARDMVRNEYWYHNRIHQWLEEDYDGDLSNDVEALNRRVYGDLFLTPDYDAWLGLVPEDTYTALEKDGCACDRMENHLKAK